MEDLNTLGRWYAEAARGYAGQDVERYNKLSAGLPFNEGVERSRLITLYMTMWQPDIETEQGVTATTYWTSHVEWGLFMFFAIQYFEIKHQAVFVGHGNDPQFSFKQVVNQLAAKFEQSPRDRTRFLSFVTDYGFPNTGFIPMAKDIRAYKLIHPFPDTKEIEKLHSAAAWYAFKYHAVVDNNALSLTSNTFNSSEEWQRYLAPIRAQLAALSTERLVGRINLMLKDAQLNETKVFLQFQQRVMRMYGVGYTEAVKQAFLPLTATGASQPRDTWPKQYDDIQDAFRQHFPGHYVDLDEEKELYGYLQDVMVYTLHNRLNSVESTPSAQPVQQEALRGVTQTQQQAAGVRQYVDSIATGVMAFMRGNNTHEQGHTEVKQEYVEHPSTVAQEDLARLQKQVNEYIATIQKMESEMQLVTATAAEAAAYKASVELKLQEAEKLRKDYEQLRRVENLPFEQILNYATNLVDDIKMKDNKALLAISDIPKNDPTKEKGKEEAGNRNASIRHAKSSVRELKEAKANWRQFAATPNGHFAVLFYTLEAYRSELRTVLVRFKDFMPEEAAKKVKGLDVIPDSRLLDMVETLVETLVTEGKRGNDMRALVTKVHELPSLTTQELNNLLEKTDGKDASSVFMRKVIQLELNNGMRPVGDAAHKEIAVLKARIVELEAQVATLTTLNTELTANVSRKTLLAQRLVFRNVMNISKVNQQSAIITRLQTEKQVLRDKLPAHRKTLLDKAEEIQQLQKQVQNLEIKVMSKQEVVDALKERVKKLIEEKKKLNEELQRAVDGGITETTALKDAIREKEDEVDKVNAHIGVVGREDVADEDFRRIYEEHKAAVNTKLKHLLEQQAFLQWAVDAEDDLRELDINVSKASTKLLNVTRQIELAQNQAASMPPSPEEAKELQDAKHEAEANLEYHNRERLQLLEKLHKAEEKARTLPEDLRLELKHVYNELDHKNEQMTTMVNELFVVLKEQPTDVLFNNMQRLKGILEALVARNEAQFVRNPQPHADAARVMLLEQQIREQQAEIAQLRLSPEVPAGANAQHVRAVHTRPHVAAAVYLKQREAAQRDIFWVPAVRTFSVSVNA